MFKFSVICLCIILFSGCYSENDVEFFRGNNSDANRILIICDAFRLPVVYVENPGSKVSLLGPRRIRQSYSKLLSIIVPYLSESRFSNVEGIELRNYFIPKSSVLGKGLQINLKQAAILNRLQSASFVLNARLAPIEGRSEDGGIEVTFVDHGNIEPKVRELLSNVTKLDPSIPIRLNPLTLSFDDSIGVGGIDDSWSVFEPFSFKVLNSERNLVVMQLLFLLLLFLLSGFILGQWWKGRDYVS